MAQPGHTGDVNAMELGMEYNLVSEMLSAMVNPMPEGGRRITLMELSIKMSKTAPAKTWRPTFQTD